MAVFIALILAPLGLPLPEDLTLLLAGVLIGQGHASAISTFFVGYFGILCADSIAWTYGRRFGLHPTGFISRLVGPSDVERIERFYRRWGAWTIVIARMVPGTRIPAFFFAGASGISGSASSWSMPRRLGCPWPCSAASAGASPRTSRTS